jgi:predicted class III extradiol MEMO1 family dioxygenase
MESEYLRTRTFKHYNLFPLETDNNNNDEIARSEAIIKLKLKLRNEMIDQTLAIQDKSIENEPKDIINLTQDSDLSQNQIDIKALLLPNANYNTISPHLLKSYKLLINSKSYDEIRRVFLIAHSNLTPKRGFNISSYTYYQTIFNKAFPIDHQIYDELVANEDLRKHIEKFEITKESFTTFYEEGVIIKESTEELVECLEDREFSFDVHLAMLSIVFDSEHNIVAKYNDKNKCRKIAIVPIWVNHNDSSVLANLSEILSKYMLDRQNFFIFSTNLTYFGRLYNFYGDEKRFKVKTFLKDNVNESIVRSYLTKLNTEKGVELIKSRKLEELIASIAYTFSKDILILLSQMLIKLDNNQPVKRKTFHKTEFKEEGSTKTNGNSNKLETDEIFYSIGRVDTIENEYEINLVSYLSLIIYSNNTSNNI